MQKICLGSLLPNARISKSGPSPGLPPAFQLHHSCPHTWPCWSSLDARPFQALGLSTVVHAARMQLLSMRLRSTLASHLDVSHSPSCHLQMVRFCPLCTSLFTWLIHLFASLIGAPLDLVPGGAIVLYSRPGPQHLYSIVFLKETGSSSLSPVFLGSLCLSLHTSPLLRTLAFSHAP